MSISEKERAEIEARQAEIIEYLLSVGQAKVSEIIRDLGRDRLPTSSRVTYLGKAGYLASVPGTSGKSRQWCVTRDGEIYLRQIRAGGSRATGQVVNRMTQPLFVPQRVYCRNDGHTQLPSRGTSC